MTIHRMASKAAGKQLLSLVIFILGSSGCAILHRTQVSEINSPTVLKGTRFEVMVSETGVNLQEATDIAKGFTGSQQTRDEMQQLQDFISMFQMGPRTGNMVFNEKYPDAIVPLIMQKCPSGNISGLMSIRETAKYPVVSGEIVKVIGYCKN